MCPQALVHQPDILFKVSLAIYDKRYPWWQGSWGQHGAHLGPTGPSWAPCWPHELCYLGCCARRRYQGHTHQPGEPYGFSGGLQQYLFALYCICISQCLLWIKVLLVLLRAWISYYIPQILWGVINCPGPWYLCMEHNTPHIEWRPNVRRYFARVHAWHSTS